MKNSDFLKASRTLAALCCACLLWGLLSSCAAGMHRLVPASSPSVEYNFNSGWRLFKGDAPGAEQPEFNDAKWERVSVPHAWNEDAAYKVSIHDLPTGVAWYRKRFILPYSDLGKKFYIEFEGARQGAEVWLNGEKLGVCDNGVTAFGFDLNRKLKPVLWENVIAVRVNNAWDLREADSGTPYQWNDKNFNANYGGITKNVRLHAFNPLHQTLPLYSSFGTTGVYIHADDIDPAAAEATIAAESEVRNESDDKQAFKYVVYVENMEGHLVAAFDGGWTRLDPGNTVTVKAAKRVGGLKFWSWGYGSLYTVSTMLMQQGKAVDIVKTRTGFRKTAFERGIVSLNDRVIQLKGYAQRSTNEWPAVGSAVPAWLSDFSNRLIVEGNGNLVRWMHITPSRQDIQSCDRVGLIQAMPAGDSEKDATGRQWRQRVAVMRDSIIYNRNSPSILFYECGNKGISEEHMAEMKALRDAFDPHGGRAIGSREMLESKTAEYGGEMLYINKSAGKPLWAMEYSRDEGLRRWWDDYSPPWHKDGAGPGVAPEYNRNQDSHAIEDVARWFDYWEQRPGTGARVSSGGANIIFSDSNTHFRGSENYRRSGEVDAMRIPKDGFWAHQVMWDGWVDVERPRAKILGHWNYREGAVKDEVVVSSAEKVELFLNGASLGFGAQSKRFLFTFPQVAFAPGTLRAVGYDGAGKMICEDTLVTAGEPAQLKLTLITGPGGMKADGADMALVQIEVLDAKGRRQPTAEALIDFTLSGPAEWRGGIAQNTSKANDNYILAKKLPVECGVNRVLIRSTMQWGDIYLRAGASGLKPANLKFTAHRPAITNGLGLDLPGAGLPSYLGRGPTPAGPSFKVSRVAIPLESVTTGSNPGSAPSIIDDNEATGWSNDGKPGTAWAEFRFTQPEPVNQVVMRLRGWRTRSYPLRVTVDGAEVWKGSTPRSLGYVTLSFPPATGQTLRVALIGASAEQAVKVDEINGPPIAGQPTGRPAAAIKRLEIDEAECFKTALPAD